MDKINERMYQANIELVDRNKLLEKDVSILQKRIDTAIEYINNHQLVFETSSKKQIEDWFDMFYKQLLEILKGENYGDNR